MSLPKIYCPNCRELVDCMFDPGCSLPESLECECEFCGTTLSSYVIEKKRMSCLGNILISVTVKAS